MRSLLTFGLASLLSLGLARAQAPAASAGSAAPAATTAKTETTANSTVGALRVALDPHCPPYAYKSGDHYSGLEVEFAKGLGAVLNRPVVFVEAATADLIPTLLDDKADIIMSGYAVNRLRLVRVAFCDSYLRVGQMALCRRGDLANYAGNGNLPNVHAAIGVVAGSSGELLANTQFTFAQRSESASYDDAIKDLLAKKVDLVLADYPVAIWEAAQNETTLAIVDNMLSREDVAWAVRKDDDALRAVANTYLTQLYKSGKLTPLVNKWIPDASPAYIAPAYNTPPAGTAASGASGTAKASK